METMDTNKIILSLENVGLSYGKKEILKDVSLKILQGEVFGILGPNGVGKSTLLSILAGILKPKAGKISIKEGLTIGYVPQEIALYSALSAFDNLLFFAAIYGIRNKKERVQSLLDFLDLAKISKTPLAKLSIGMKRRINIGAALLHDPDIIVMDEPTVGIDLSSKRVILEEINRLKEQGKTFVFTTHHPDEPEKICNRIGLLKNGILEACGSIKEVKEITGKNTLEELMI